MSAYLPQRLVDLGLYGSRSRARMAIAQGRVAIDGRVTTGEDANLEIDEDTTIAVRGPFPEELGIQVASLRDGVPRGMPAWLPVNQVDGAIENGTRIKKVRSEEGDATPIGSLGTVLASLKDEEVSPRTFYFVEWDHTPGVPVGLLDWKIAPA